MGDVVLDGSGGGAGGREGGREMQEAGLSLEILLNVQRAAKVGEEGGLGWWRSYGSPNSSSRRYRGETKKTVFPAAGLRVVEISENRAASHQFSLQRERQREERERDLLTINK